MAATSVETGIGRTPGGHQYIFNLTKHESGGRYEVRLKDLKYSREGDNFFVSPRILIGGYAWELRFRFSRKFTVLPWLCHGEWRTNLKASLLSATERCLSGYYLAEAVGKKWNEYDNYVVRDLYSDSFTMWPANFSLWCMSLYDEYAKTSDQTGFSLYGAFLWTIGSKFSPLFLVHVCIMLGCAIGGLGFWVAVDFAAGAAAVVIMAAGVLYTAFAGCIWLLCYGVGALLWHQSNSISSTLRLLTAGQPSVVHKVTIHRKWCRIFNKTQRQRRVLSQNETCELEGIAYAAPCLKPNGAFCSRGWLTITADFDIERPASDVPTVADTAHVMEEGQSSDLGVQSSLEGSECVVCLVNRQTSGFAHHNEVHICVCEECAKVYENLRKKSKVRCPICNQQVEYMVYKVF